MIRAERIDIVELLTKFSNGNSFVFSRFFFNEKGLCFKLESIGSRIAYPRAGPFTENSMQRVTLFSYDDDGRLTMEEVHDINTRKLEETIYSYRGNLLERSTRNRSFETGDSKSVIEKRYEYDDQGSLRSIDSYSYKIGRSQSKTQFLRRGGKVITRIVSSHMDSGYNNIDELIEDTSFLYDENDQLTEAITKCNTGDESIDRFTYETPMSRNIKKQHRTTNRITDFKYEYIYLNNGLISMRTQESESLKMEIEYIYNGGK